MKKASVILVASLLLAVWITPVLSNPQPEHFDTSLHATRAGKDFWYGAENGGFENWTNVPIEDLGCTECHGPHDALGNPYDEFYEPGCSDCHGSLGFPAFETQCFGCHGRQGMERNTLGYTDVHADAGMKCWDCHTTEDMHGDGTVYGSMLEPGAINVDCEDCHTPDTSHADYDPHGGDVHCTSCHAQTVISCYNCHFESVVEAHVKRAKQPLHDFVILANRDKDNKVYPLTFQSLTYQGSAFAAFGPFTSHTITRTGARICTDCHANLGGTIDAIDQYNATGEIKFAGWSDEDSTLSWTHGVVPFPTDYETSFKMDFITYNGDPSDPAGPSNNWSSIGKDTWDGHQLFFATPLTATQMSALGMGDEIGPGDTFPTSLHATRAGKERWYGTANGGFEQFTNVPIEDLHCTSCHGPTDADGNAYGVDYTPDCVDCHPTDDFMNVSQDQCLGCHGRQGMERNTLGYTDVHADAGFLCWDCHTSTDMHGDGNAYGSMLEPDAISANCEECHSSLPPTHAANDPHSGALHCTTCHAQTVISCYNCHFESQLVGVKRAKQPLHDFVMLVNRDEDSKVYPATFQSLTYQGDAFAAFGPFTSHTITRTEARVCTDCHANFGGSIDAIDEYNATGGIKFATWSDEDSTLSWVHGVVPMPTDYETSFKMDFITYNGDPSDPAGPSNNWSSIGKDTPDGQHMLFASPLTEGQMTAIGMGAPSSGYVGDETCGTCHANSPSEGFFDGYMRSGHPWKIFHTAGIDPPADTWPFTPVPPLPVVEGTQITWADVEYTIGNYHWKTRYIDRDGYIYTGLADETTQWNLWTQEFVPYHAGEVDKPFDCGRCHTTGYDAEGGNQHGLPGLIGTWEEDGIRCEACHGPGATHVADPVNVPPPGGKACADCHYRDSQFRMPWSSGFMKHHQQSEDLSHSAHKDVLTCESCHDPHKSVVYDEGGTTTQCLDCHPGNEANNFYVVNGMEMVNCIDCHMPMMGKSGQTLGTYEGDIRGHLFQVMTDPIAAADNVYEVDGSFFWNQDPDGNAWVTVDYACLACHEDTAPILNLEQAALFSQNVHNPTFPLSLHSTRAGKEYWYGTENGGFEQFTDVPIEDLGCVECHGPTDADGNAYVDYAPDCVDCHPTADFMNVSQDQCLGCHGRQGMERNTLGYTDVHADAGFLCWDCHTSTDMHGDGNAYSSMLEPDAISVACEDCHETLPAGHESNDPHGGALHCTTCHAQTVISCYNCHFESQVEAHVKRAKQPLHDFVMLVNRDEDSKVYPATFQSLTYQGNAFAAFGPFTSHTITRDDARTCQDCHANFGGSIPAIDEYNLTGEIKFATWSDVDSTLSWLHGIVPMPENYETAFKMDFITYNGDPSDPAGPSNNWSSIGKDTPDGQHMLFATPLTFGQMESIGMAPPAAVDDGDLSINAISFGRPQFDPILNKAHFSYALPQALPVHLTVWDVSGRVVKTLVNDVEASGRHEVTWETNGTSAGIYFCKFKAGDFTDTQRVVILR